MIDHILGFAWTNQRGNSHERPIGPPPQQAIPEQEEFDEIFTADNLVTLLNPAQYDLFLAVSLDQRSIETQRQTHPGIRRQVRMLNQ